jgi:hypothetical protein
VLKSYRASIVPVYRGRVKYSELRIYGCQLGVDPTVTNHPLFQNPLPVATCKGKPNISMLKAMDRINILDSDNFHLVDNIIREEIHGRKNGTDRLADSRRHCNQNV